MRFKRLIFLIAFLIPGALVFLQSCGNKKENEAEITVSIEPLKYFVEELTSWDIEVNVMVPMGASPATYSPTASQLTGLSSSRLYVQAGYLGFEQAWMPRLKELNPELKVLNLSTDLNLIRGEDHVHGDHVHKGGVDPHIWMSPKVVMEFLPRLRESLIETFPEYKQEIVQQYPELYGRIKKQHEAFAKLGTHLKKKEFMIFHPALTYLARDYGLKQIPLEYEGKEPTPQKLRNLIDLANKANIKVIFIQVEFDRKSAGMVTEETDASLVPLNPLAHDWDGEMKRIHDLLEEYLK
ncbi:metal ABC transporter solute-binding protein, Zn/Mn family [Marinilabilia rubra]|uniref:Zinc ABC transporter substrate-binding protein n=1 Tax=Marinilabilia rubra TaxID=2162893 RepID=A0A2U2BD27_9BACT|nr:zinc ABC transporter substrate-binding protein [Marinilabilia rubra]PWE00968.1 zinc ABC transporter substrate-binding protein [Marinilabilia rubra]